MLRLKSLLIFCMIAISVLPYFVKFAEIRSGSHSDKFIKLYTFEIEVNDEAIIAPSSYIFLEITSHLLPVLLLIALFNFRKRIHQIRWCFASLIFSAVQFLLMAFFIFDLRNFVDSPQYIFGLGLLLPLANVGLAWFTCNRIATEQRTNEFNYFIE